VRLVMATFLSLTLLVPAAAQADFFKCQKDGKTWVTNYRDPYATKCHKIMTGFGNPTDQAKVAEAARTSGGASTGTKPRKRTWKPPRKVTFQEAGAKGEAKLKNIHRIVALASAKYNLPEAFIHAIITVESSYKVRALSYKGAMGLMQLMPGTAADMGVTDAYDPYQNIMGATKFLRILANRFEGDLPKTIAAFHSGGGAVSQAGGIAYQGSDGYVRKVLDNYYRLKPEFAAQ
jgi:soluble lytic murein transglycosylase-like protein